MESQINLRIAKFGETPTTAGHLRVRHFNSRERSLRAAKFFFIFVALGIFFILIPVLHFFLVPACAVLAPTSAIIVFLQTEEIVSGQGICPYCAAKTQFERAKLKLPFRDSCTACHQLIQVELA